MKNRLCYLFPIIIVFLLYACSAADETSIIAGQVVESGSGSPIEQAIVEVTQPEELQQTATTDSVGNFSFDVDPGNETANVSIEISKQGYETAQTSFKLAPETNVDDLVIELTSPNDNDDDGDDEEGEDSVGGEPEGPAAIILDGIANQAINIKETGDQISSAFTFVVQDSAGRPINNNEAVDVDFTILSGPGGSEELIPKTATTNAQGRVTSSLFSGNVAGPVKIQASINRSDLGVTIKSSPVLIAIHGGFPDPTHFSIAPSTFNFEGYSFNNIRNTITVIVGDKYSNPVKPGTVVYFNTTGGVIQGSGETDEDGIVTVDLISGDPRPNDDINGSGGRPGYATVIASTVDENNNVIKKETNIVFSGIPQNPQVSPTTFDIPPNGGENFTYTVTDQNGNPLPPGTQFTVEVGEGLDATGDADFKLGDYLYPGPGSTEFAFSVTDTDEQASDVGGTSITIRVTTPHGESASTTIQGTRAKNR